MDLSDLIAAYGNDNVEFQMLDECASDLNMNKGITKITFGTPQPIDLKGTRKLGLVMWFDRERVKEILAAEKKGKTDG